MVVGREEVEIEYPALNVIIKFGNEEDFRIEYDIKYEAYKINQQDQIYNIRKPIKEFNNDIKFMEYLINSKLNIFLYNKS